MFYQLLLVFVDQLKNARLLFFVGSLDDFKCVDAVMKTWVLLSGNNCLPHLRIMINEFQLMDNRFVHAVENKMLIKNNLFEKCS